MKQNQNRESGKRRGVNLASSRKAGGRNFLTSDTKIAEDERRRRWLAASGLNLLVAALLVGVLWDGGYFPSGKWTFSLLMLAAAALEVTLSGRGRYRLPVCFWPLAALAGLAAASVLWSVAPGDTWREIVVLAALLAAAFTAGSELRRPGVLELLAAWLAYCGAFAAGWGIITYLLRMAPYSGVADGVMRAGSTFGYANALSCFSLMALPVTGALLRGAPRRQRPLLTLAISLETAAVILTFARFGYIILPVVAAVFIVTGFRRGDAGTFAVAVAAGLAVAVVAALGESYDRPFAGLAAVIGLLTAGWLSQMAAGGGFGHRRTAKAATLAFGLPAALAVLAAASLRHLAWQRFVRGLGPGSLLPHRLQTFAGALAAIRQHLLFGSGLGTFAVSYQLYAEAGYSKFAHNLVLQFAVDLGLNGGILMAALLLLAALAAARRLVTDAGALPRAFAAAALVFIAYNLFDWEWYFPALAGWFVVAVAAASVPERDRKRHRGVRQGTGL